MAKVNVTMALMSFNNTFSRLSATPLDSTSVHYSFEDAQSYAQTNPYAYVGQIISVVDQASSTAKAYMIMNTEGDLEEIGTGSGASTIIVANQGEMLALQDIEVGQVVFREDTSTTWIYKGPDPSQLSSWQESAAQNDTVWDTSTNKVLFSATTLSAYNSLETKNPYTLYFLTDVGKIYKGTEDVTSAVVRVDTFPSADDAVAGKLYVGPAATGTTAGGFIKIKVGAELVDIVPGYYTDGANWASAASGQLATIGLIKKGIQEAVDNISYVVAFDSATGKISFNGGTDATLTGVAYNPAYDDNSRTLTIKTYGGNDVSLTIPDFKDKFVSAGKYYEDYPEENPTHHKVIVLTIENQVDPVIIPAEALVDVYTGVDGNDIKVTVSAQNQIAASVKIDPASGDVLTSSGAGLKVDVSSKMDKIASATGSKVALTEVGGGVVESSFSIISGDTELGTSDTQLATAKVIAAAINAAQGTLQNLISGKMDKLSGEAGDAGKVAIVGADGTSIEIGTVTLSDLATKAELDKKVDKVDGTVNNVIIFSDAGAVKDSGKKIGGAVLSDSPDDNTVATEAAVNEIMSWKTIE